MQEPELRQVLVNGFSAAFFVGGAQVRIGKTEIVCRVLYGKGRILIILLQIAVYPGRDVRILAG